MDNPFIEDGFLCLNVSINKLFIAKMPTDKVDENLEGKTALDIFSTDLFIKEIKKNAEKLKLDMGKVEEKMLPQYLNDLLESDDPLIKETANKIVELFGKRLAVILLTLKKGERENRCKRSDWNDKHWEYWAALKNVILVGGLASSKVGEKLKYYVEKVFKDSEESCYNIILNKNSANIGIKGCATYIKNVENDKLYLIFDCGQTFIKRSLINTNSDGREDIENLNKVLSKHVDWEFSDSKEEKKEAYKLHGYLLNTIVNTIEGIENRAIGSTIVISIANYVRNGLFANRGGYGKLRLITDNYEEYLSCALYEKVNQKFKVKLVHDGTAMAAAFSNYPESVCISLGTAFGVGFPIK